MDFDGPCQESFERMDPADPCKECILHSLRWSHSSNKIRQIIFKKFEEARQNKTII